MITEAAGEFPAPLNAGESAGFISESEASAPEAAPEPETEVAPAREPRREPRRERHSEPVREAARDDQRGDRARGGVKQPPVRTAEERERAVVGFGADIPAFLLRATPVRKDAALQD